MKLVRGTSQQVMFLYVQQVRSYIAQSMENEYDFSLSQVSSLLRPAK